MKTTMKTIWLTAGLSVLVACGGSVGSSGSGGASTTTRDLTGSVDGSGGAALAKAAAADSCVADTILATDSAANTTSAAIADDCSFTLSLEVDKSYVISFLLGDTFVATLLYDDGTGGVSGSAFPLLSGSSAIDLGTITFSGTIATPGTNPLSEIDTDGDGEVDSVDSDDDGDGIADSDEVDCDLDGFHDDEDDSSDCATTVDSSVPHVVEAEPRNDPDGNHRVSTDEEVKARVSCVIDQSTVTADSFAIASEDGSDVIECSFEYSGEDSGDEIKCKHESQDFMDDTVYIATMDGVTCEDGTPITAASWTWKTKSLTGGDGVIDDGDGEDDEDSGDDDGVSGDDGDGADDEGEAEDEAEAEDD